MWTRSFDKFERAEWRRGESLSIYNYDKRAEWKCLFDSQPIAVTHKWFQILFLKSCLGMEHRVTDSNLIISRSDLNVLKNVLVDKIHEKSTLTVQRWRLTLALTSQNTQFMYTTNTRLNICLGFFISFLCYFPWFIIFESLNKLHKYCKHILASITDHYVFL